MDTMACAHRSFQYAGIERMFYDDVNVPSGDAGTVSSDDFLLGEIVLELTCRWTLQLGLEWNACVANRMIFVSDSGKVIPACR